MDLILLEPGDQSLFGSLGGPDWSQGQSLIDPGWRPANIGQCIELVSMHQGMKQQISTDVLANTRTSGRPVVTEFTCVKYVDKTSVKLYEHCLSAKPIGIGAEQPTKLYVARNSGDKTANIITISLRDAIVSEIQLQSHPDDMPTEQFKLNFTEILWAYTIQNTDLAAAGTISAGWSLTRNRPITAFTD